MIKIYYTSLKQTIIVVYSSPATFKVYKDDNLHSVSS